MNKNKILIIIIAIIIILITIFAVNKINKDKPNQDNVNNTVKSNIKLNYNNEAFLYEILDESTGEVIVQSEFEDEINYLYEFYKENPDYRANPPLSPNVENEIAN